MGSRKDVPIFPTRQASGPLFGSQVVSLALAWDTLGGVHGWVKLFPNILEVKNPNFRINVTAYTDFGTQPVLLGSEHHWSMQDPTHVSLIHSFLSSFIRSAYQALHRP